jgi:hypothetical protein
METHAYCDNIMAELSGWKSKIDNVVSKFDHASSNDKKRVLNEVNELHKISEEFDYRIEGLKRECAGGFKPEK